MFPNKFIVMSDTESNPLRQYQILSSGLVYLERNGTYNFGKKMVIQNFFLSSKVHF